MRTWFDCVDWVNRNAYPVVGSDMLPIFLFIVWSFLVSC